MTMTTLPHFRTNFPGLALAPAFAAALLALAGCSDGTGGGAGDGGGDDLDPFTPSPIEPFVGTWDLAGDWSGTPGDEALLVIRPVQQDGLTADVRVYDFDETDGCYFRPARGEVELDGARQERVFMNRVYPFEAAELTLSGATLVISYFDEYDIDDDGDTDEVRTYDASSVAITETDIETQLCF